MAKPNIHKSVSAICRKLDLDPHNVGRLVITPTLVVADVYKLNAEGKKHLIPSEPFLPISEGADSTGFSLIPAKETLTFEVRA